MAQFEIKWRGAKLTLGINALKPYLYRFGKGWFSRDTDNQILARSNIVFKSQLSYQGYRVLLKRVIDCTIKNQIDV